jgi:hypothetical protein
MNYDHSPMAQAALDAACEKLSPGATSDEMIRTWIGKPVGGMILIPWNRLVQVLHELINEIEPTS